MHQLTQSPSHVNHTPTSFSLYLTPSSLSSCSLHVEEGEVEEAAPSPSILKNCNMVITRGMRVVVRGPNGAGEYFFLLS